MPLFSCVNPDVYATTRRRSGTDGQRLSSADINLASSGRDVLANNQRPAGVERVKVRPVSYNGQAPRRALSLHHNYMAVNGNVSSPKKLQKRNRVVTKSMIGSPKDFIHHSHLDRVDACNAMASPAMADIAQALRQDSSKGLRSDLPQNKQPAPTPNNARASTDSTADTAPLLPTANGRRKAPPPITPSLIKATGLPATTLTVPVSYGLVTNKDRKRKSPLQESVLAATGDDVDGLPQADESNILSPPRAMAEGDTLKALQLSPSMKDLLKRSSSLLDDETGQSTAVEPVSVPSGSADDAPLQPPSMPVIASGPLNYMTDSARMKWNGSMAEIAKQLRSEGV